MKDFLTDYIDQESDKEVKPKIKQENTATPRMINRPHPQMVRDSKGKTVSASDPNVDRLRAAFNGKDNGKLDVPYERSMREGVMNTVRKIDNYRMDGREGGNNGLFGAVTAPINSAMKLLKPQDYIKVV